MNYDGLDRARRLAHGLRDDANWCIVGKANIKRAACLAGAYCQFRLEESS